MSGINFVSTRFAGTDGVSLESEKWARMLQENGHEVFWFAGHLDRDDSISMLVPTELQAGNPVLQLCRAALSPADAGHQRDGTGLR